MNFLSIFALSTIPAGISIVLILQMRNDINRIMKRENPKFTGHINNTFDVFRIISTLKKSIHLSKTEKNLLKWSLFLVGIGFITVLTWIIIFIFFLDLVF